MFGRAGRRGLDEIGYVLMLPDIPRLGDARPRQLKRATQVDWPSLISVMRGAADRGEQPFAAAVELSRSLFSTQQVPIGAEHSLSTGPKPCGFWVDAERARFVRRPIIEILNSRGRMGTEAARRENVSLGKLFCSRKRSLDARADSAAHARPAAASAIFAGCAKRESTAAKFHSRPSPATTRSLP